MSAEKLKEMGVVGAGGAGFPTYVKANSQVEFMIANGAECEPWITCDDRLMREHAAEVMRGAAIMQKLLGAGEVERGRGAPQPLEVGHGDDDLQRGLSADHQYGRNTGDQQLFS